MLEPKTGFDKYCYIILFIFLCPLAAIRSVWHFEVKNHRGRMQVVNFCYKAECANCDAVFIDEIGDHP